MNKLLSIKKLFENKQTGDRSSRIYDVLSENLTIDKNHVAKYYYNDHKTLFDEINIIPYYDVLDMDIINKLSALKFKSKKISVRYFQISIIRILSDFIEKYWDNKKNNIVFHSSGYDSRLLSGIIRRIYNRRGDDWLGNILFICLTPEHEKFLKIMRYEGWYPNQFCICPIEEGLRLDFDNAWKELNGTSSYPVNGVYHGVKYAKMIGRILSGDDKIRIMSMSFLNELFLLLREITDKNLETKNVVHAFFSKYYYSMYSDFQSVHNCEVVTPILNFDILKLFLESDVEVAVDMRKNIVKMMDMDLYNLERYPDMVMFVNSDVFTKSIRNYTNSWYGKNIKPEAADIAFRKIAHGEWWSAWSAASFTEHLIKNGYKISIK